MIGLSYGVAAALGFVLFITVLHSWFEMKFDQRATAVFDEDDERTEDELTIIHGNQLPIRGLLLVITAFAADMRYLLPALTLIGVACCVFWIFFDIFCAVVWLGKPWYYVGDPPPMNPYMFFFLKVCLFLFCSTFYVVLVETITIHYVQQINQYV